MLHSCDGVPQLTRYTLYSRLTGPGVIHTLRRKVLQQSEQGNGLSVLCFLVWVMRLDDWEKDLSQIRHRCGFSPEADSRCESQRTE